MLKRLKAMEVSNPLCARISTGEESDFIDSSFKWFQLFKVRSYTGYLFFLIGLALPLIPACRTPKSSLSEETVSIKAAYPEVQFISPAELLKMEPDDVLLVDSRTKEEFAVSHLPGAVHLEEVGIIRHIAAEQEVETVVVYCSVGWRSADLVDQIQKLSDGNAPDYRNLEGSLFGWANLGLPLQSQGKITLLVHPYNADWANLLNEDIPTALEPIRQE